MLPPPPLLSQGLSYIDKARSRACDLSALAYWKLGL
jgi:hypothetical protein